MIPREFEQHMVVVLVLCYACFEGSFANKLKKIVMIGTGGRLYALQHLDQNLIQVVVLCRRSTTIIRSWQTCRIK